MRVDDAERVRHGGVDRAVDHEAGRIDRVVGVPDDLAVEVDLHQIRGGDFAVVQAERVDQEVMLRTRHAHRDVVEDHLGPTAMSKMR